MPLFGPNHPLNSAHLKDLLEQAIHCIGASLAVCEPDALRARTNFMEDDRLFALEYAIRSQVAALGAEPGELKVQNPQTL